MNVALSELPDFTCRPGTNQQDHHGSGIVIGPTSTTSTAPTSTRVCDGWSREPVVEMLIPSTLDDTLAPPGQHVASLFVQHVAPHLPGDRSWDDAKEEFADLVIDTVGRHAPNFKASRHRPAGAVAAGPGAPLRACRRRYLPWPADAGPALRARPVLGHAGYRMPVPALYLCGSGAHPGGGVTGAPGHNAAREIIRDLKSKWRWG